MDMTDAVAAGQHPLLDDDMHAFTAAHLQGEATGGGTTMQPATGGDDADTQPQPQPSQSAEAHPLQSTRLPDEVRVNEPADTGGEGGGAGEGEGATQRALPADAEMTETQAEPQPGEEAPSQSQLELQRGQMAQPTQLQVDTDEQAQPSQTEPMPSMTAGEAEKQQREGHPGSATPRESASGEAPPSTRAEGAQEAAKPLLTQEHLESEMKKEGQAGPEPGAAAGGGGQLRTAVGQQTVVPLMDTRTLAFQYTQLFTKSQVQPLTLQETQLMGRTREGAERASSDLQEHRALMHAQMKRMQQPQPAPPPGEMVRSPCYFCTSTLQFPADATEVQCPQCHGLLLPARVFQTVCPGCTQLLKYELNATRIKCPACETEFEVLPHAGPSSEAQQQGQQQQLEARQQLPQQQPLQQPLQQPAFQAAPPLPPPFPSSLPVTPTGASGGNGGASVASGSGGKTPKAKRERGKRVKEGASPLQPKRGLTAKMLFTKAHREEFKAKYPGRTTGEVTKLLGEAFSELPEEKKATWTETAAVEKARYEREKAVYDAYQQQQQQQQQPMQTTPEQAPAAASQAVTPLSLPQQSTQPLHQQHQPQPQGQLSHPLGIEAAMLQQQQHQLQQLYRQAAPYMQRAGEFVFPSQAPPPPPPSLQPLQTVKTDEFPPPPPPQLPPMQPDQIANQTQAPWPTETGAETQQQQQQPPSSVSAVSSVVDEDVKQLKDEPPPIGNVKMDEAEELKQIDQSRTL